METGILPDQTIRCPRRAPRTDRPGTFPAHCNTVRPSSRPLLRRIGVYGGRCRFRADHRPRCRRSRRCRGHGRRTEYQKSTNSPGQEGIQLRPRRHRVARDDTSRPEVRPGAGACPRRRDSLRSWFRKQAAHDRAAGHTESLRVVFLFGPRGHHHALTETGDGCLGTYAESAARPPHHS